MSKHSMKKWAVCATLAAATGAVWAQTTTAPNTTVGVTPQEAKEATQKAVPRADTATLVRTEPSAVTRAEEAAKNLNMPTAATNNNRDTAQTTNTMPANNSASGNTTSGMANNSGMTNNTNTNANANANGTANSNNTNTGTMTARAPRADRN